MQVHTTRGFLTAAAFKECQAHVAPTVHVPFLSFFPLFELKSYRYFLAALVLGADMIRILRPYLGSEKWLPEQNNS